jgi:hypothetical protein
MSPGLLCSALLATAIGLVGLRALWPGAVPLRPYRWLVLFVGVGLGLGITAVGLFGWLVVAGVPDRKLAGVELVVLAALAALLARRRGARAATPDDRFTVEGSTRPRARIIVPAFVATLLCAVAAFIGLSASRPHGGWDAWMNWNLRARLLFRGGPEWRAAFSPLLEWSHPDYPLLAQGSVVRAWVYGGGETLAGPSMIAFLFTFATLGLVTTAVAVFRGRTQAMLAGLVLLGTPFFIFHGTSQYGDVPVGYYFLATLVLAALHDRHGERTDAFAMLAGLTAGLAAWTKNEGIMFLAAVVVARLATAVRPMDPRRLGREARAFAIGLLPMLVIIGYFKLRLAPPNDLMSAFGSGEILGRLADPRRYLLVARAFATGILGFGANGLVSGVWLLVAYGLCVWVRPQAANTRWLRMTGAVMGLMLLGHAAVFVATAEDVARLLDSSLERLLLQLWPATVFASFMLLATPSEAAGLEARPVPAARADPA